MQRYLRDVAALDGTGLLSEIAFRSGGSLIRRAIRVAPCRQSPQERMFKPRP